jgi:hypothetical protein
LDPPTFETGGIRFFQNVGETLPECQNFTSHKKINPEVFRGFTWFLNTTDGIINSIAFLMQFSSLDKPKIAVFCDTPQIIRPSHILDEPKLGRRYNVM